jgi:hypothetical protein
LIKKTKLLLKGVKMKKLLFTAAVLLASVSFAGSSDNLILSGEVTLVNELVIFPNGDNVKLNILAGESNKKVAYAEETSNNLLGYKIYMRSVNASKLVHGTDPSQSTDYTISYDGKAAITLTNADQEVKNVASLTQKTTNTSDIVVNVTAKPTAPAGTYSDTVTISIVANN